jgi:hypothetical protein
MGRSIVVRVSYRTVVLAFFVVCLIAAAVGMGNLLD